MLITILSCRAIQITDLQPEPKNIELLPYLEPQIDYYSLQSAYSSGSTTFQIYSTGFPGESNGIISLQTYAGNSVISGDQRMEDVVTLYERDVERNICDFDTKKVGYIVCEIPVNISQNTGQFLYYVPHLVTLGISSLLGIPNFFLQTEIELQVEIFDLDKNRIARYSGYGKGKVASALYWGYRIPFEAFRTGRESGVRKANNDAFKMAMIDIKEQIEEDHNLIIKKLNP